ncbi:crossover junction endodeoxyribonuclease RuvC [Acaricomes phytoseiuli]|nr:crossover junction endodeoxyribonuclease RuvC [Acaricomes phytoseiuli]MCW1249889.1 crossover junction endodeoxyribonuclease RuvC [Acaricomes phytoseiuli]
MRVFGIDPGLTRCGFGVVDSAASRRVDLVAVDVVGSSSGQPLAERLFVIAEATDRWLERYQPEVLAVERVFSQTNLSTVMGVAQVSGIVMAAAARHRIPVALHTPSEIKAAVTGNGRADKTAVATMVARILRLDSLPQPADAADALALAITHSWRGGIGAAAAALGETGSAGTPGQRGARSGELMTPARKLWLEAEAKARKNQERSSRQWR